jgi:uncharacterized protein
MLGRLARLMRFAGYDVEYDRAVVDDTLRKKSRYKIILTKDRPLAASIRDDRVYFVNAIGGEAQLAEIQAKFSSAGKSRCLLCNRPIKRIVKKRVQHLVPPFVFKKYDKFFSCPQCKRVYWKGTHFNRMLGVLASWRLK